MDLLKRLGRLLGFVEEPEETVHDTIERLAAEAHHAVDQAKEALATAKAYAENHADEASLVIDHLASMIREEVANNHLIQTLTDDLHSSLEFLFPEKPAEAAAPAATVTAPAAPETTTP